MSFLYDDHRLDLEVQHLWRDNLWVEVDMPTVEGDSAAFADSVQDPDILWSDLRLSEARPLGLKGRARGESTWLR